MYGTSLLYSTLRSVLAQYQPSSILRDTEIQGYRDTGIQGYRDTEIQIYRETEIQGSGIQRYRDTGIHIASQLKTLKSLGFKFPDGVKVKKSKKEKTGPSNRFNPNDFPDFRPGKE